MTNKTKKRTLWQILVGEDFPVFLGLYAIGIFVTIVMIVYAQRGIFSGGDRGEIFLAVALGILCGPGFIVLAIVGHIFRWLGYRWGKWS